MQRKAFIAYNVGLQFQHFEQFIVETVWVG